MNRLFLHLPGILITLSMLTFSVLADYKQAWLMLLHSNIPVPLLTATAPAYREIPRIAQKTS
ncbi:MAG: hypothetical protein KDI83_12905 [Gammaproteobacteria bacterium]|nr:hypothetical protein [Gammaproteobacteria bacterium]